MRERFWEEMSVNFTSASSPTMNGKMPHIQCTAEEIGEIVLLPGDPGRVAMFEDLLEDYKIVSNYREYVVGTDITTESKLQCARLESVVRQRRSLCSS